jgi:sugar lactone lactonase YvrE
LCLCGALLVVAAAYADEIADSRKLTQEALAAYKAKDAATFLAKITAASDLRPSQSALLYYRAAALALNGRDEEARALLERVARMGMVYDVAGQPEFSAPEFKAVAEAFSKNKAPIGKADRAFMIAKHGIISEGVAHDPASGDFFVSSVRDGAIWRIHNGKASPWVTKVGRGVFGMAVDSKRRLLWAATSPIEQNSTYSKDDHAAVIAVDLRSGHVVKTIAAPDNEKHVFGDVAIGSDGTVYVSDSESPTIFVIDGDAMRPFLANGPFSNLQGIAPAKGVLYVADYAKGIAAIDLATHDLHFLSVPPDATLLGVDGIYLAGPRTLIATQNGTTPQRVLRIDLDGNAVSRVTTLAANLPEMPDITLGTLAGSFFYFNGAALWDEKDEKKWVPAVVLRTPVNR